MTNYSNPTTYLKSQIIQVQWPRIGTNSPTPTCKQNLKSQNQMLTNQKQHRMLLKFYFHHPKKKIKAIAQYPVLKNSHITNIKKKKARKMKILCYNRFWEKIINAHITNIQKLSSYHENATIGFHRKEFQRGLATVFKRLDVLVLAAELDGFSFLQMVYFLQNLVQYTARLCTVKYQRLLPILDELGSSLLELTPNPMISRSFYFQHGEQSKKSLRFGTRF